MSRVQRIILSLGAILICAALLFPPWMRGAGGYSDVRYGASSAGFHFLFTTADHGHVNTGLLFIEIAALIFITGLCYLAAKPRISN